ncbi:MAG: SDR family oxidoreductase [Bdellovibrionaceae bacterium]|nr:SDR family oxidoreductase [Pseudobdellovibrionaceae bacterium]
MKKAVLITGAGSGIGKATALEFSKNGYFVHLMGRDKQKLEDVALHCRAGAALMSCDLTDVAAVTKRVGEIIENPLYQVEVLVNNAGIFKTHTIEDSSDEMWREQFEVNMLAPMRLTRLLTPYFKKHRRGSVVNVSSTLGMRPSGATGAYSASKAALNNWTQLLAQELGPLGIRVNCVCPGLVDTPIHPFHLLEGAAKDEALKGMAHLQPLGRIGTPEDVARSIYFVGSDLSGWTTGAIMAVDGGINLT